MGLTHEEFAAARGSWTTQGRTVTETDITLFCGVSGDFNPLHSDEDFSRGSSFGGRVAHGPLVQAVAIGLLSQLNLINGTALGLLSLHWDFKGPVRAGDTVHAKVRVIESRPSRSQDAGVVTLSVVVINQVGEVVQDGRMTLLMASDAGRRPLVAEVREHGR